MPQFLLAFLEAHPELIADALMALGNWLKANPQGITELTALIQRHFPPEAK